tara:strand:+ start:478 stop:1536 length:1059 start_codon:yes stop_codon:yes gene_type:complete
MKNIIKTIVVMLTSVSLFTSANAGALDVSGTAKATYNIVSGNDQGKGIGITNELNFTAAGELDNGYTWSYSMELDPADGAASGAANNDDTKLTLTTPMGTLGIFVLEGGLDLEDGASQSVYSRPTDMGDPSATSDNFTIDSYNNIQLHTAAGMLPYGMTAKIAYATDLDTTNNSGNATGAVVADAVEDAGDSATEVQIKATPMDGLVVGASYMSFSNEGQATKQQEAESGAIMATYTSGPLAVGVSEARKATLVGSLVAGNITETVENYNQRNMSIAYAVNDDISVSYERETSEANYILNTTAAVEQESDALQLAYTMGGMTLAVSHGSHDNVGYVDGQNRDQTLVAMTMAF